MVNILDWGNTAVMAVSKLGHNDSFDPFNSSLVLFLFTLNYSLTYSSNCNATHQYVFSFPINLRSEFTSEMYWSLNQPP